MSAGTRKHDFGSQWPAVRAPSGDKAKGERLRIVRLEEAVSPAANAAEGGAKSLHPQRRPLAEYPDQAQAAELKDTNEELATEMLPTREPGVDLAAIRPSDLDAGKLAAFLHDIPSAKREGKQAAATPKAVVMPLANTDLREIFQADGICMVARPQASALTPAIEADPKIQPACATVPPQQNPPVLDKTQRYLVDNWPKLPPNVQAAILNVIDAATGPDDD